MGGLTRTLQRGPRGSDEQAEQTAVRAKRSWRGWCLQLRGKQQHQFACGPLPGWIRAGKASFLPLFPLAASAFQASSFKALPVLSTKSSQLLCMTDSTLQCPLCWSPSVLLQPLQVLISAHPNQGQTLPPHLLDSSLPWRSQFHLLIFLLEQF